MQCLVYRLWLSSEQHHPHSITKVEHLAKDTAQRSTVWPITFLHLKGEKSSTISHLDRSWFSLELGPEIKSTYWKSWSYAAHSAAKQLSQDDHVNTDIQSYFNSVTLLMHGHSNATSVEPWLLHERKELMSHPSSKSWQPPQQQKNNCNKSSIKRYIWPPPHVSISLPFNGTRDWLVSRFSPWRSIHIQNDKWGFSQKQVRY